MATEGITVLEEWFRWGEEWSMILRMYGAMKADGAVLEIGCGLGRIAFALRYILRNGSYEGFDIVKDKIDFLDRYFHPAHSNFRFIYANIHNSEYNPAGEAKGSNFRFPYPRNSFDLIFAASVFTHMLPDTVANYFEHSARVLKPGGRCIFSFFLLDNYRPGQPRPLGFGRDSFNFDHQYGDYGDEFATVVPENPEQMTAYRLSMIERFANHAGLKLERAPVPGLWSGQFSNWITAQDLVVLRKPN
jgi:SAM-dependent methyltransferase